MRWNLALCVVVMWVVGSVSCSKRSGEDTGGSEPVDQGWELISWDGGTAIAGHVFLQLADNRFTLYQSIGDLSTAGYLSYTGTYTLTESSEQGTLLRGVYADGNPWKRVYVVEAWTSSELRLRSLDEQIVSVYAWSVIPDYVKLDPVTIRSRGPGLEEPFL